MLFGNTLTFQSFDLPADVFVEGDVRPPAPKQKKAPKAKGGKKKTSQDTMMDDATSKKRSFTETGLDVGYYHDIALINQSFLRRFTLTLNADNKIHRKTTIQLSAVCQQTDQARRRCRMVPPRPMELLAEDSPQRLDIATEVESTKYSRSSCLQTHHPVPDLRNQTELISGISYD